MSEWNVQFNSCDVSDIVAVVGDLTDGSVEHMKAAAKPLSEIRAKLGKFFVSGNNVWLIVCCSA